MQHILNVLFLSSLGSCCLSRSHSMLSVCLYFWFMHWKGGHALVFHVAFQWCSETDSLWIRNSEWEIFTMLCSFILFLSVKSNNWESPTNIFLLDYHGCKVLMVAWFVILHVCVCVYVKETWKEYDHAMFWWFCSCSHICMCHHRLSVRVSWF